MHTFIINVLSQLYWLRHVSNNRVFILRKTYTYSFMVFFSCIHISSLVDVAVCWILYQTHPNIDQTAYMGA